MLSDIKTVEKGSEILSPELSEQLREELATIFNGLPKSVERHSGGQIHVKPTQVLFVRSETEETEVRIKVLFQDLERNSQHQIVSKKLVTKSKLVRPSEIKEGLYLAAATQPLSYVIDFGLGIIPIRVVTTYQDASGVTWAVFVNYRELEKGILYEPEESSGLSLTLYEAPQCLLRWIEPLSFIGEKDFQWAKHHAAKLEERGEILIPSVLETGQCVFIPKGSDLSSIEAIIKETSDKRGLVPQESFDLLPLNENTGG